MHEEALDRLDLNSRRAARRDFVAAVAIGIAATVLTVVLHLNELVFNNLMQYERFELEELPLALTALAGIAAWYAFRRFRDAVAEAHQRSRIALRLAGEVREHENAITELRDSETRYRSVVEDASQLICRASPDGAITFVNAAFCRFFGQPSQALIGRDFLTLVYPADRDTIVAHLQTLSPTNPTTVTCHRVTDRDGATRWLEWTDRALFGTAEQIREVQCIGRDITEQRGADEALHASEQRFRDLVEGSIQGILIHRDHKPLFVNPTWVDMYGFASVEEALAIESLLPLIDPAFQPLSQQYHAARLAGAPAPAQYELEVIRKNGERMRVLNVARRVMWEGAPAVQSVTIDITEQTRSLAALRTSEQRYRDLVEGSIQGVAVLRDGKPLFVNQTFARMHGLTVDEVMALGSVFDLLPADERRRLTGYMNARMAGRPAPAAYEFRARHKNGSILWLENRISVVQWEGSLAIQCVIVDISERKAAEQALRASEQRYRDLLEGSIQGIMVHRDGKPLFVNTAFADMLGYTVHEVLALGSNYALLHPDEHQRLTRYVEARLAGKAAPGTYEFRALHKSGATLWLENRVSIVQWEGRPAFQLAIVDITERKAAEQRLRASEERYRDLVEASIQGIVVHRDYKPLFINKAWANIFGFDTVDEVLALDSLENVIAPDERERLRTYRDARMAGQSAPAAYECRGLCKDGTVVWLEFRPRVVQWEGEPAVLTIAIDITERKRAEQALRDSERRFKDFAAAANDWFWEMGPDLRFTFTSDRVLQYLGLSPEWHLGKRRRETIAPGFDSAAIEAHEAALKRHESFRDFTVPRLTASGEHRWVSISGLPAFDRDGRFAGYRGSARDVTDRMRVETRLRNVFDMPTFGAMVCLPEGRFIEVNDSLCRMLGYDREELLQRTWIDLTHPADVADAVAKCERAKTVGPRSYSVEKRYLRKDGSVLHALVSAHYVERPDGTPEHVVALVQDIGPRIAAEEQAREHQAALTYVLRRSTMGEMAAALAHEMNQPLAAVVAYCYGCRRRIESGKWTTEDLMTGLELAAAAAHRAANVIRHIRGFVQRSEPEVGPADINVVVRSAMELAKAELQESSVVLRTEFADGLPAISVNTIEIEQVLLNLILNGIEAIRDSDSSLRELTIATQRTDDGQVEVSVRDTGPGLQRDMAERIFEPFVSTKSYGLGMGLSISRSIIEGHGGSLSLVEDQRPGCAFAFTLPSATNESDAA